MTKVKRKKSNLPIWVLMSLIGFIFVVPFILMVMGSFSETTTLILRSGFWIPNSFYVQNWINVFTASRFATWLGNSLMYTIVPVVTGTIINSLVGYVLSKKRFRGRGFIFGMFLATMLVPGQMALVPNYIIYGEIGILNTPYAILIPGMWSISNMFLVRQYMMSLPDSIIEAAAIDGSGDFRTFFVVILPMIKTPVAIMAILASLAYWNNFLSVLIYMTSADNFNLPVGLATMVQRDGNFGAQMVGALVTVMPVFVLYIFCQRYFIEGISVTGIKS